jgi:GT2 family glycosyltransferase
MKDLTVAALITNFNTWPLAQRCAEAIIGVSGKRIGRVLIVDDASAGPVPEGLPPGVEVLRNERNKGYVRSVNRGFRAIEEEVVLLFDSDAFPLMDLTFPVMDSFLSDAGLGALGFYAVGGDGRATGVACSVPGIPGFVAGQRAEAAMRQVRSSAKPQELCLYSFAVAVRNKAFRDTGGFDESFDFLDADLDFSMRLRASGWTVRIRDDIRVFHEGGGSPQCVADRVYRQHKSRWLFLRKHTRFFCPSLLKSLLALRHLAEYLAVGVLVVGNKKARPEAMDRLRCRKKLMRGVWSGYGNELREGARC